MRHLSDLLRPDIEGQLRVDGVVRMEGRVDDRGRAEVCVVVGADIPGRRVRVGLVVEGARHVVGGRRVDPLVDSRREHEHLEGRPGLSLGLCDEVELVARATRRHRRHRLDRTGGRIDRDECRRRVGARVERADDRLSRRGLQAWVDRRVDLQPTRPNGVRPVLGNQLVADVAEEVGLANPRIEPAGNQVQIAVRKRGGVLAPRQSPVPEHRP